MSRVGDWYIEHEETVDDAIRAGWTGLDEVVWYCKKHMELVDENAIQEIFAEWYFGDKNYPLEALEDAYVSERWRLPR